MILGPVGRGLCGLPPKSYFSKSSFPPFCDLGFQRQISSLFSSIFRLQVDGGVGLFSLGFYDCCFWYPVVIKSSVGRQLGGGHPFTAVQAHQVFLRRTPAESTARVLSRSAAERSSSSSVTLGTCYVHSASVSSRFSREHIKADCPCKGVRSRQNQLLETVRR